MPRQEPSVTPPDRPGPRLIRAAETGPASDLRAGERMVIASCAPEDAEGARPRLLRMGIVILVVALALMGGAGLVRAFVGL
jgi:hypothetical protein